MQGTSRAISVVYRCAYIRELKTLRAMFHSDSVPQEPMHLRCKFHKFRLPPNARLAAQNPPCLGHKSEKRTSRDPGVVTP